MSAAFDERFDAAPFAAKWSAKGEIVHVFTHFELRLAVFHAELAEREVSNGRWTAIAALGEEALPSVMKKAITQAIPDAFKASRERP